MAGDSFQTIAGSGFWSEIGSRGRRSQLCLQGIECCGEPIRWDKALGECEGTAAAAAFRRERGAQQFTGIVTEVLATSHDYSCW